MNYVILIITALIVLVATLFIMFYIIKEAITKALRPELRKIVRLIILDLKNKGVPLEELKKAAYNDEIKDLKRFAGIPQLMEVEKQKLDQRLNNELQP